MSKLTVHIVLDRSGSMASVRDDTIGAFNTYVSDLAKAQPKSTLSLTIFDSAGIDTILEEVDITKVKPLDRESYVPRASTPLYDALGVVIAKLTAAKGKNKALVIITDGYENASREHSKASIKAMLDEKQEKDNWLVIYLGADQDAFAAGSAFGAQVGNTMNYSKSAKGLRSSFAAASASTARFSVSGSLSDAAFTTEEREEAAKDK